MKLSVYYMCPAGNRVAVIQDALNDAPEEWPVAERSIFGRCDECGVGGEDGYCKLKLEKIVNEGEVH